MTQPLQQYNHAATSVRPEHNAQFAAIVAASRDAIISIGTDLVVMTWNAGAHRMFGYGEAEARGRRLTELITPDIYKDESAAIHASVLNGETVLKEILRRHKGGQLIPVEINTSPILDFSGRVIGASVIYRNLSDRRYAEEVQARLAAIVKSSADAIIGKTLDGFVTSWNEAAERMFGYAAREMIGQSIKRLVPADRQPEEDVILSCLARSEYIEQYETRLLAKDGRTLEASITISPVRDAGGAVIGCSKIIRDITARKRAEEELRKSDERFKLWVLHSPLPTLLIDDQERILALSQSWLEGSGYSREELGCMADWTARAYGESSGQVLGYIRQTIATEPQLQTTEMTIRTKDGRERIWSFACSALGTQSDGRRLFSCVAQDVTEKKNHEEQIHLLMRELNHRAKNILSLVQAIARQTAAREAGDFLGRFTERIQALAANQDLLVRNEWRGVDVEDLVRAQLAHFADLVGSRINVEGPKLRLDAAAAQAIGLALHELATNAGKYGALAGNDGRVGVGWRLDGDIFAMSWAERDGPPVSRPERRGFGSTVIDLMARRTLGGEVELDYAPSGLVWRLTCPARNALEQVRRAA